MEREGRGGGRDRQGVEGYCWGLIHYLTASTSSLFIIDIISVQMMKKKMIEKCSCTNINQIHIDDGKTSINITYHNNNSEDFTFNA